MNGEVKVEDWFDISTMSKNIQAQRSTSSLLGS